MCLAINHAETVPVSKKNTYVRLLKESFIIYVHFESTLKPETGNKHDGPNTKY